MSEEPTQLPDSENPHAAEFAVLEALKAENESLKDQRLRALAEAENIRRRAEKEKADASQYAVTKFARDMLGIADNFARACRENGVKQIIYLGGLIPEGWRSSQFFLSSVRDAHQFIAHDYDPLVRLNRQAAIIPIDFLNSQDRKNQVLRLAGLEGNDQPLSNSSFQNQVSDIISKSLHIPPSLAFQISSWIR